MRIPSISIEDYYDDWKASWVQNPRGKDIEEAYYAGFNKAQTIYLTIDPILQEMRRKSGMKTLPLEVAKSLEAIIEYLVDEENSFFIFLSENGVSEEQCEKLEMVSQEEFFKWILENKELTQKHIYFHSCMIDRWLKGELKDKEQGEGYEKVRTDVQG